MVVGTYFNIHTFIIFKEAQEGEAELHLLGGSVWAQGRKLSSFRNEVLLAKEEMPQKLK